MTTTLPPPLVPPEVNLDGMPGFLLDTHKLLKSSLLARASDAEFRSAVLLWCRAWLQNPAGSLPDDDAILCDWAGCGRDRRKWRRVRTMALYKFIKCSDGRLYHPVLCEDVMRAWKARRVNVNRTAKGRASVLAARKPGLSQTKPADLSPSQSPGLSLAPVEVEVSKKEPLPLTPVPSQPQGEGGAVAKYDLIEDLIGRWPKTGAEAKARNVWLRIVGENAVPAVVHERALEYLASVAGQPVRFVSPLWRWLDDGSWSKPTVPKDAVVPASAGTSTDAQRRLLIARTIRFGTAWRPDYGPEPTTAEREALATEYRVHLRAFVQHRVRWDEATWGRRPTVGEQANA